jgi:hypothetical protein
MLAPDRGVAMEATHRNGYSRLVYFRQSVQPGMEVAYSRRFWADYGGIPISKSVEAEPKVGSARATVRVVEKGTEAPVKNAYVELKSPRGGGMGLAVTDADGRGRMVVPGGRYLLTCRAVGRAPFETEVSLQEDRHQKFRILLPPPARIRVTVRELRQGRQLPTAARVTFVPASPRTPHLKPVPGFSGLAPGGTALVPESGVLEVPVPAASGNRPGCYVVAASKGPLYTLPTASFEARAGAMADVQLVLRRSVDARDYVPVDFYQADRRHPASGLTRDRRTLLNSSEGIEVGLAMKAGHWWTPANLGARPSELVPAGTASTPATGPLAVLPAPEDLYRSGPGIPVPGQWGARPDEVFGLIRRYFPQSLILVKNPHLQPSGYFATIGLLASGRRPKAYSSGFDGLLVAGSRLRQALPHWFSLLNRGERIVLLAGSESVGERDAVHMAPRTYVQRPNHGGKPKDARKFLAGLRDHPAASVSNGPLIRLNVDGQPVGSTVKSRDGQVVARVRVDAPRWVPIEAVRVYLNGEEIKVWKVRKRNGDRCLDRKLRIPVEEGGWIVAAASAERSMAPIYLDRDGQGTRPFAITNPVWVRNRY